MKIGILTSSRADFGIYKPLLAEMQDKSVFSIEIIAFGSHLTDLHGASINEVIDFGLPVVHRINTNLASDDQNSISTTYGLTVLKFADFWKNNSFDYVFCLGDRYEMSASVQAGIPFRIKFIHLYGGEVTLGAIDNIYRDQISIASILHFTSTKEYAKNVARITGNTDNIHVIGSLSLDENIDNLIFEEEEFRKKFKIPEGDFILVTFHPETMNPQLNNVYVKEMNASLVHLMNLKNLVITLPNADTYGSLFRDELIKLSQDFPEKVIAINSFGRAGYFSALNYCSLVLGNSSSGIVEAASFKKFVVNVGNRQKGRATSNNVLHCRFKSDEIKNSVQITLKKGKYLGSNIYYRKDTAENIVNTLINFNKEINEIF